jgi:hypothetical protein
MLLNKPLQLATIVLLAIVGGLYWYSSQQQQRYDAAATQFLNAALTDIGSWQREALRRQLADEALQTVDNAQLDALIDRYRALGAFKQIEQLRFARLTAALSLFNRNTLLSYHGNAQFENGSAALTATIIVSNHRYRLYNFSLANPQLRGGG